MIRIALYQPDIAQNAGALFRLAACFGLGLDLIEPAGFPVSDRAFRRAGMDYIDAVDWTRHDDFEAFDQDRLAAGRRLVLLTTKTQTSYADFAFRAGDALMLGRESSGCPAEVHARADHRLTIPMRPGMRSLNVAVSGAIVAAEALRQLGGFASSE